MAYSLVQQKHNSANSGSTASVTGLSATTAGNLLVMLISASKNPGDVTFTPPVGWTLAGSDIHNDVFISISTAIYYYANNPGGITSVSTTLSSTVSAWHIDILEFSGVATASPLDATHGQEQDHTTTPTSGLITTTVDGDLLIGWAEIDDNNGAYTFTEASGWTSLTNFSDTDQWSTTYPAWETAGAAGSYQYKPTKSNSVTDCTVLIAAFKPASGGGTPVALSGTLGSGEGVSGTLTPSRPLDGVVGSLAGLAGTLVASRPLQSPVQASGGLAGTLTPSRPLTAALNAGGNVQGTLAPTRSLSGSIVSGGALSGVCIASRHITGALSSGAALAGTLSTTGATFRGTIGSDGGLGRNLEVTRPLSGLCGSNPGVTGRLTTSHSYAGTLPSGAGISGSLSRTAALRGTVAGNAGLSATCVVARPLSTTLASGGALRGNFTVTPLYIPGTATLTDKEIGAALLSDTQVGVAILTDTLLGTATLTDIKAN